MKNEAVNFPEGIKLKRQKIYHSPGKTTELIVIRVLALIYCMHLSVR